MRRVVRDYVNEIMSIGREVESSDENTKEGKEAMRILRLEMYKLSDELELFPLEMCVLRRYDKNRVRRLDPRVRARIVRCGLDLRKANRAPRAYK